MKRVIVALKNKKGDYKIPKFCECIIDYFNKGALNVTVDCDLNNDVLVLSENPEGIILQVRSFKLSTLKSYLFDILSNSSFQHSIECPIREISEQDLIHNIPLEKQDQYINVAVSIIIESSDNHVLLTRRPAHMRTSPKIWVPPGGHLGTTNNVK